MHLNTDSLLFIIRVEYSVFVIVIYRFTYFSNDFSSITARRSVALAKGLRCTSLSPFLYFLESESFCISVKMDNRKIFRQNRGNYTRRRIYAKQSLRGFSNLLFIWVYYMFFEYFRKFYRWLALCYLQREVGGGKFEKEV
jgi:hypothetical protein